MDESNFRRSLDEVRSAGTHLRSAGELLAAGMRGSANELLRRGGDLVRRVWDSRPIVTARRRVESWRFGPSDRPELVKITLKEQAKVIEGVAKRLSASRDELEELSRLVGHLEERFGVVGRDRAA